MTMLKKLMVTTALGGFMIGSVAAQTAPADKPAAPEAPPAATQPMPADKPPTAMPERTDTPAASAPKDAGQAAAPTEKSRGEAQIVHSQAPDQVLASKFRGTDVVGADGEKVGTVSDILFSRDGRIEAYVLSIGGFLGIGAKEVALAPESFETMPGDPGKNEAPRLRISMSQEQLKQAQAFQPYNPPRTTTGAGRTARPPAAPAPSR